MLAILDGDLVPAAEARLPVTDEGLLRGDGVFEVLRLYAGRPFALDDHLARMARSAEGLRLPLDRHAVRADIAALCEQAGAFDGCLRFLVTRGAHRIGLLEPLPEHRERIALACVTFAPTRLLTQIKSLSYAANVLATRLAREQGAEEALLCTPHGRVLEGPTSSFFCVLDGDLVTPPLSDHVLDSITRRHLLTAVRCAERPLAKDDLGRVEEAFLASTTREVQPVGAIDGRPLSPGPRTREAAQAFRALVEAALA